IESFRLHERRNRRAVSDAPLPFLITQLIAGFLVAGLLLVHIALLLDTVPHTSIALLHFSLHPWEGSRLTMQVALLAAHGAAIGLAVVVLRAALARWRIPRRDWGMWIATLGAWALPALAWQLLPSRSVSRSLPLLAAIAGALV